jgi:hypothetical protein
MDGLVRTDKYITPLVKGSKTLFSINNMITEVNSIE